MGARSRDQDGPYNLNGRDRVTNPTLSKNQSLSQVNILYLNVSFLFNSQVYLPELPGEFVDLNKPGILVSIRFSMSGYQAAQSTQA